MKFKTLFLASCVMAFIIGCSDEDNPTGTDPAKKVLAIVDVMTLNDNEEVPEGFTGVGFSTCTEPYLSDITGTWTAPSDVNIGIGGDTKYIWVKYEKLPVDSRTPVLVDVEVRHWPYWCPDCPEGWELAGPLTTGTELDCWRNGLNVKYLPLAETDSLVATLCLSITEYGHLNSCPDSTFVCDSYVPRELSPLDIHKGCGDDYYVYISYYRPAIVR